MSLIDRASHFAIGAHSAIGQVRKHTGEPYWLHPRNVALRITNLEESTAEMVAAAWMHDVAEDTAITVESIRNFFGKDVGDLVEALTDTSRPEDGNRATRKAIDRKRLAAASAGAQTIKLADLMDNSVSILEHDPKFAITFMEEFNMLHQELTKADPILREEAQVILIAHFFPED